MAYKNGGGKKKTTTTASDRKASMAKKAATRKEVGKVLSTLDNGKATKSQRMAKVAAKKRAQQSALRNAMAANRKRVSSLAARSKKK